MAIISTPSKPVRRKHGSPEAKIQTECFVWAWNNYPETRKLFFHVANEVGENNAIKGALLRSSGVIAGVADMLMLIARGRFHGLCVEFKTEVGRQSPAQIEWQERVEKEGYHYVVCRSLEQFKEELEWYLSL